MLTPRTTLLVASMAFAPVLRAQTASVSGPPMEIDAPLRTRLITLMSNDLKSLFRAESTWFKAHGEFGHNFERGAIKGVKLSASPGVTVTLTYVTTKTYAARATHDWLSGRSCVMVVGDVADSRVPATTAEKKVPRKDGTPVCDSK